jgi:hypothetical protein
MTRAPHPKVVAATTTAGAASLVVGYALHIPPEVAAALVTVATFLGGYAKRADA